MMHAKFPASSSYMMRYGQLCSVVISYVNLSKTSLFNWITVDVYHIVMYRIFHVLVILLCLDFVLQLLLLVRAKMCFFIHF